MSKNKVLDSVKNLLETFLSENGYELYNIEFVKNGKDYFLRVYIDRPEGSDNAGIGTDDCEFVSKYLSDKLDKTDLIDKNYYLEVSSPGLDRPLLTKEHYIRYKGYPIEVSLYKGFEGKKKHLGVLGEVNEEYLELIDDDGSTMELPMELIAKTNLQVII